ncbi:hypothetical protein V8G54_007815 [Vigna mungo]|uniref:glucose-1-phosphate adenylyltransferase n=1 Tax=Vigna mungo TaxID=3915 RepID=A0AAQ3S8M6_VIGMU
MESTRATLGGILTKVGEGTGRSRRSGFWGESTRGSGKTRFLTVQSIKTSRTSKNLRNSKPPGVPRAVLTSDINEDSVAYQRVPTFETPEVNPKSVASIILGGGAGTRLFPLTGRRAKPAVPIGGCYRLIDIPMSNCINSGIRKIFILTQFNSFSLNRHLSRTYSFGNGMNFGDGFVESVNGNARHTPECVIEGEVELDEEIWQLKWFLKPASGKRTKQDSLFSSGKCFLLQVLAATQTPGEAGKKWFQGTADAVRQFIWVFEDAKNKNVEHILILSGDHLYRMDYMDFVQRHVDTNADITVSCVPMDDSRASDYGLMKIDKTGRIVQFAEKPKGSDLKAMRVDTTLLGLSPQEAEKHPYIASMGVYVFRTETLLQLLRWKCSSFNDFGSEIIPSAVNEHNVQAYLFNDYWEDIGTIKSFFDANLALTEQPPKFEFYDPKTPFFTSPRFLPPTKVEKCKIVDAIISHGCFLRDCSVQHSIVGVRSRLESGVELQDTMMMGADYYQTESEIASLLAEGKGVQEADRAKEGFYIRSGITITLKNATIKDGTVI